VDRFSVGRFIEKRIGATSREGEPIDRRTDRPEDEVMDEDGDSWDVARRGAVRRVETM
jgi:hypothetical protein